jgi:hypothetical protein
MRIDRHIRHHRIPPFARIPSRTSSQGPIFRDEITTEAPSPAMLSAIARPIPRDDPVTIATLPSRRNISVIAVSLYLLPPQSGTRRGCQGKASGSKKRFFEKKPLRGERRKKLLLYWAVMAKTPGTQISRRFLLLFFKKEALSSLACRGLPSCG